MDAGVGHEAWCSIDTLGHSRTISSHEFRRILVDMQINEYDVRIIKRISGDRASMVFKNALNSIPGGFLLKLGQTGCLIFRNFLLMNVASQDGVTSMDEICRRLRFQTNRPRDYSFVLTSLDHQFDTYLHRLKSRVDTFEQSLESVIELIDKSLNASEMVNSKSRKKLLKHLELTINAFDEMLESCLQDISFWIMDSSDVRKTDLDALKGSMLDYQGDAQQLSLVIDQCKLDIEEAETSLQLRIDVQRNTILIYELLVLTVTTAFSIISAGSGLLGQNLDNVLYMPNRKGSFIYLTAAMCALALMFLISILFWFRRLGIFSINRLRI